MEISLPPALQQFISDQVAQGVFPTANDAVCTAVEVLRLRQQRDAELRTKLDVGLVELDRGEGQPLNIDAFIKQCRENFADVATRS